MDPLCCWAAGFELVDAGFRVQSSESEASKGGMKVGGIFPSNSPYIRDP